MANCLWPCLKCLFCFFNVLLFLVGITMFSLGLWLLNTTNPHAFLLEAMFDSFHSLVYISIVVGAFTMFLGLWGSLGLFYDVQLVLSIYIPLLILIVSLHLFPSLFMNFQEKKIEDNLTKNILSLIQNYNPMDGANQHKAIAWDYAQVQLSCCGWTGPENWKNNTFFQSKVGIYPCSCSSHPASFQPALGVCRLTAISHKSGVDDWPVTKQGCGTLVQKRLKKVANNVFFVSFVIVFSEILGISLSFYICARRNVYAEGHS